MKIADINPHIRFAEQLTYSVKHSNVYVKDCRLFYIISGNAKIFVDNSEMPLTKNTLFYCCGGTKYTIETGETLQLYSLNFDLSQHQSEIIRPIPMEFNHTKNYSPIDKCNIKDSDFLNSFLLLKNATEFKPTISDITKEYSIQKAYFRENCSSILKLLLIKLHKQNSDTTTNSSDAINKIIAYVTSNFAKEIKNSELAEIAGYHEYYLNRLFIRHTGTSMHKYILNLRINESKRLLLNTNLSISDIASRIGFNSHTHFSTYFKKETGLSPFEYKNNFKNNI
ncbi:MAG: helix-turn-helix transcriptional regulator [Clostridia bacterium]|nr:helix-turn-helix transcriptional regulator [Oscillospiraceae bacterium]MBQ7960390.1 helix-turn-helix transcriptional regulator [Clostridia bacterium]